MSFAKPVVKLVGVEVENLSDPLVKKSAELKFGLLRV